MNQTMRLSRSVSSMIQLLKVQESGSINKAAEAVNLSQPALTRSIAQLEKLLGATLLQRSAKGVTLTAYGEVIVASARAIEAQLDSALREIKALQKHGPSLLRIGATPLVAHYFLMPTLSEIAQKYSNLTVRLIEGSRPALLAQLRLGELDLLVSTFPFDGSELGLAQHPIAELDLRVVVRSQHALAKAGAVTPQDLASARWVLPRADSSLSKRVARDLRAVGVVFPNSSVETSSLEATRSLVQSSDVLAILPLKAIEADLGLGNLVVLSGSWTFERRTVGVFMREADAGSPPLNFILRHLRASADQGHSSLNA